MGKIVGVVSGLVGMGLLNENSFLLKGSEKLKFDEEYAPSPNGTISQLKYYPFRQLSKTLVGAGTVNASDFSEGNVLFDALPLFDRIPACFDHEYYSVQDIKGAITNAYWQEEYIQDGRIVPAGINAVFALNPKLGDDVERVCTLLDSEISPKVGCSITLYFDFKASHDGFTNVQQFQDSLGKVGADGRMVRRIAQKIRKIKESSIVFSQADAFAKRQKEGKLELADNDPDLASFQITDQDMVEVGKFFLVEKPDYSVSYFAKTIEMDKTEKEPNNSTPPLLGDSSVSFQDAFGVQSFEELTKESFETSFANYTLVPKDELAKLKTSAELQEATMVQFAELKQTKEQAEKQLEKQILSFKEMQSTLIGLQADLKNSEKELTALKSFSDGYRSTVEKAYRLSLKDKQADEAILSQIQSGSVEQVNAFANLFGTSLNDTFGLKCQKCGSDSVQFGSAKSTSNGDFVGNTEKSLSIDEELRLNFYTKKS